MAKKKQDNDVGGLLFAVSLVLAVLLGAFNSIDNNVAAGLAILGILTGFFVMKKKDTKPFLWSGTMLVVVGALATGVSWDVIARAFEGLVITFAPAVAVLALSNMLGVARD